MPKCHVTFFPKFLSHIFASGVVFNGLKDIIFGKKCHITQGGKGYRPMSQNDTGGEGGSKISQKSVTYYFNGPLRLLQIYAEVVICVAGSRRLGIAQFISKWESVEITSFKPDKVVCIFISYTWLKVLKSYILRAFEAFVR